MPHSILTYYLTLWAPLGYGVVFIGMILEGDIIVFTAAFLTHLGAFHPLSIFAVMMSGVLVGDLLWYRLGETLSEKSFLQRISRSVAGSLDTHILERPFHTIFLSKFIIGAHHAVLMRAGALHFDKKKFFQFDCISSLLWIGIVGGLGYFSSASFVALKNLRHLELGLLLALLVFIFLERITTFFLQKSL